MKAPEMKEEDAELLLDKRFVRVFDLKYNGGRHYYNATRHDGEHLTAFKSEEEFRAMLPDAVTCAVILRIPGEEPRLLLSFEYRYPAGRFLLSPPAGLLDPEDALCGEDPVIRAAKREIFEETGIRVTERDRVFVVNRLLFSSPGLTDESNALAAAVVNVRDLSALSQKGSEGSECFDGFELVSLREAKELLERGTDPAGHFYSVYTWCVLEYFVSEKWRE